VQVIEVDPLPLKVAFVGEVVSLERSGHQFIPLLKTRADHYAVRAHSLGSGEGAQLELTWFCRRHTEASLRPSADWLVLSRADSVPNLNRRLERRLKAPREYRPTAGRRGLSGVTRTRARQDSETAETRPQGEASLLRSRLGTRNPTRGSYV
jgi:hypothetical protein